MDKYGLTDAYIPGKFNPSIDYVFDVKWTKPQCEISAAVLIEAILVYFDTDLFKKPWVMAHNSFLYPRLSVDITFPREMPVVNDGSIL